MPKSRSWATLGLLLLIPALSAGGIAQDEPKKENPEKKQDKPETPDEKYTRLTKEYRDAQSEYFKLARQAKTIEERRKVASKAPRPNNYTPKFFEIAEQHPESDAALNALLWVTSYDRRSNTRSKALGMILENHIESPKLATVCQTLARDRSPETGERLKTILEKSPHHEVKGQACFGLAQFQKNKAELVAQIKNADERRLRSYNSFYGKEQVKELLEADPQTYTAKAEKLFEQVVEKYGDIKSFRGTLADAAEPALFELRYLSVGKEAPDIEAEDVDGEEFKLSDYRGKVVMLDFWGDW